MGAWILTTALEGLHQIQPTPEKVEEKYVTVLITFDKNLYFDPCVKYPF